MTARIVEVTLGQCQNTGGLLQENAVPGPPLAAVGVSVDRSVEDSVEVPQEGSTMRVAVVNTADEDTIHVGPGLDQSEVVNL